MSIFYRFLHNMLNVKNVRGYISYLRRKNSSLDKFIVLLHRRYMLQKMRNNVVEFQHSRELSSIQDSLVSRMLTDNSSFHPDLNESTINCYIRLKRKSFDELDKFEPKEIVIGAYLDALRRFPSEEEQTFMFTQFFDKNIKLTDSIEKIYSYLMVTDEFSVFGTVREIEL